MTTAVPLDRRVRAALIAGGIVLALVGAYLARGVLLSFVVAIGIAYILDPAVSALERRGVGRVWGILLILAAFVVLVAVLVALVVPEITDQLDQFRSRIPGYVERMRENLAPLYESLQKRYPAIVEAVQSKGAPPLAEIVPRITQGILAATRAAWSGLLGTVLWVVKVLFVPVFAFYLLHDFPAIRAAAAELVPLPRRAAAIAKASEVDLVLRQWFRGQVTVSCILTVIYCIGLPLLGVPLGLLLGFLGGFGNMVPYMGLVLGMAPAMLLAFLESGSWVSAAAVAALFTGAQILEGTVLSPRILGEGLGLKPVLVLLSVLVGGEIFGVAGVLVAVPVTAAGMVFVRDARRAYMDSAHFTGVSAPVAARRLPLRRRRPVA